MKKLILYIGIFVFAFSSCETPIDELNIDSKNPPAVPSGALFANANVALFDFMTSTNVNTNNFRLWAQQWAQTTYPDESNYQLVERDVNGAAFRTMYTTVLRDLQEAVPIIDADQFLSAEQKGNQKAIISILEVLVYSTLVDIFGDVPYSAAFTDDFTPAYDDDEEIYGKLFTKLDEALGKLSGSSGLGSDDLVYGGNTVAWKKMGNTLKFRMAMRIADQNPTSSQAKAEAAISAGIFDSSADNFALTYTSSPPNTNPLWVDLVQSGRSDFVAANTIADYMNNLNDPRRDEYFSDLDADGNVLGGIYGAANNYSAFSHAGAAQIDPTTPGVILDYTQVLFLLADAAERGYNVPNSAEDYYNMGVTESILMWGGTAAEASAYLAQADVAYSTAPGTWKEKIAMQKWLALYDQGFEAWTTYRMYDAPAMNVAEGAGTLPPNRYTYPTDEFSLNGDNVKAAGAAMGGDDLMSKVFWDMN